jgi:hypothetical protein
MNTCGSESWRLRPDCEIVLKHTAATSVLDIGGGLENRRPRQTGPLSEGTASPFQSVERLCRPRYLIGLG